MKRFVAVLAASVLAAATVLLASWTALFEPLNFLAYDFTMRLAGPVSPESPTTIVAIDEASLAEKAWPWPRERLARLVEAVAKGQPRVVVLDIVLNDNKEGDEALISAIGNAGTVVLPARIDTDEGISRWLQPRSAFLHPGVTLGHVHVDPDVDTTTRRVYTPKAVAGIAFPALSIAALQAAGFGIDSGIDDIGGGAVIVRPKAVNIRFAGDVNTFPQVSAAQVLKGQAPPDAFRNRIVLIGATAEGLEGDRWLTPLSRAGLKMPGVEIHANAIDTLYAGRAIEEVTADIQFAAMAAMIFLLVWMDRRFEGRRFYVAALLLLSAMVCVSWLLMKYWNLWFPFPPYIAAIVLVLPGLEAWKVARVNRDLDSKIKELSQWGEAAPSSADWNPADRVSRELPASPQRETWLAAIAKFEQETSHRRSDRLRLLGTRWRNSKWRLGAVDFFQDELVRFLSFNSAILGSIEDITVVSDVGGRVVYQNPAARRLEGFSEQAPFAPTYFAALLDGRDFTAAFAEVFAAQKTVTMPFVPTRVGRPVFHVAIAPIGRTALVLSLHDATAQFELNLAKNEMVGLVSHELRTPLTAIRGYSDMLLKYDLVHEKGRQFLGTIVEESDRLNKLIQSFLDIAYIESGRQKVSKTEFEIGPVVRDMISVLDPVAAAKSIRLLVPPDAGDAAMNVHADRLLLYQALTNLVTNAIKYSPNGTTVRIAVSNGSGRVAFHIADEGCGISAEDTPKIFDKFYRRANKETLEQTGFGLGLAFVKEVAVRHGGEVTVESEVGKGSVFTLHIPT